MKGGGDPRGVKYRNGLPYPVLLYIPSLSLGALLFPFELPRRAALWLDEGG